MKVLVVGSGGREHAIVWKLRQSQSVEQIWCAPGNGGIADDCECFPLDVNDVEKAANLAARLGADLTIVGAEAPLVAGIANEFAARGMALLGPMREAAQLEGSKVFAKSFMQRRGIPTARTYGVYDSSAKALAALANVEWPVVIKADGLCAGKGVLVTSKRNEAAEFIEQTLDRNQFGAGGLRILLEQGLAGDELSYIVLTDGKSFMPMAPTRDYKRAYDGDEGPNTGGMGAYSSDDILDAGLEEEIRQKIVKPTLAGLREEGLPYRGFLYFGLMLSAGGPRVLEFNCRLGDPEAQAIVLRADFDFGAACQAAALAELNAMEVKWHRGASLAVVIASEGYPGAPMIGREIAGLSRSSRDDSRGIVFHGATRKEGNCYYTCGGRVLAVAARAQTISDARSIVYGRISSFGFSGEHYRRDIGLSRSMRAAAAERANG